MGGVSVPGAPAPVTVTTGKVLIMPQFMMDTTDVKAKTGIATVQVSNVTAFYTAMDLDFTDLNFEVATLSPVADTLEQTIVDTGTGKSGVLTQILSPTMLGGGVITIRVTIDGNLTTFTDVLPRQNVSLLCIGDFANWSAQVGTTGAQFGAENSTGYSSATTQAMVMLTPQDSASKGLPIGMVFTDSMKVTVQGSLNLRAGSSAHKAVAAWLTYIPAGVLA